MSIATREVCVCDQCGRERDKDTNHWWVLRRQSDWFWAAPFDEDGNAALESVQHLCGLTCLYQAIDKLAQEILKREAVAK